jgi:signal transduction histidine kinase
MKKNSSIVSIFFYASIWPALIIVLLTITLTALFFKHHIYELYNRELNRHELVEQRLLNEMTANLTIENTEAISITLDKFRRKHQLVNLLIFDKPFRCDQFNFLKFLSNQSVKSLWPIPGLYPKKFIYISSVVAKDKIIIPFFTSILVIFLFILVSCLMYIRIQYKLYHQIVLPLDQTLNYEKTENEFSSLESAAFEIVCLYRKIREFVKTLHLQRDLIENQNIERAKYSLALQVAHDIRSPVLALKAISAVSSEMDTQCRQVILNVTNRISQIADDILKKHNRPNHVTIRDEMYSQPLSKIITEIIEEKKIATPNSDITYDIDITPYDLDLKANIPDEYLYRIFSNIINNATESISSIGLVTIHLSSELNTIHVTIADTGCGISPYWIKDIFKPGYTNKVTGNGLGLSYAKSILESRKGSIELHSTEGKGTSVRITLQKLDIV